MGTTESKDVDYDEVAVMGQDSELLRTFCAESLRDAKFLNEAWSVYRESTGGRRERDGEVAEKVRTSMQKGKTDATAADGLVELPYKSLVGRLMKEGSVSTAHTSGFSEVLLLRAQTMARLGRAIVRNEEQLRNSLTAKKSQLSTALAATSDETATMLSVRTGVHIVSSLLRSVSRTDPELCTDTVQHFLELLRSLPTLGLSISSDATVSTMTALSHESLAEFAEFFRYLVTSPSSPATAEDRVAATSALIGLALSRGSLADTLELVQMLLASEGDGAELDVAAYVLQLAGYSPEFRLSNMSEKELGSFSNELTTHAGSAGSNIDSKAEAIASDGSYVYVHDKHGLAKLGTGANDTIPGHVYASVAGWRADERGSLAVVAGRLYYRSPGIAPAALLVLSTKDLSEIGEVVPDGSGSVESGDLSETALVAETETNKTSVFRSPLCTDGRYLYVAHAKEWEDEAIDDAALAAALADADDSTATPLAHAVSVFDPLNNFECVSSRFLYGNARSVGRLPATRQYYNSDPRVAVDTELTFPCDGVIESWTYAGRGSGPMTFQVYRKVSSTLYTLIGENDLETEGAGESTVNIAPANRIRVKAGDMIGWKWTNDRGQIYYDRNSTVANVRYTSSHHFGSTLKVGDRALFTRTETCCMSIRANLAVSSDNTRIKPTLPLAALNSASFYTNGALIAALLPPNKGLHTGNITNYAVATWDLNTGSMDTVQDCGTTLSSLPTCYDYINNLVWNYSGAQRKVRRWACSGCVLRPIFPDESAGEREYPVVAHEAVERLADCALPESPAAALVPKSTALSIVAQLDRLATAHVPPDTTIGDVDSTEEAPLFAPFCIDVAPQTFGRLLWLLEAGLAALTGEATGSAVGASSSALDAKSGGYLVTAALRLLKVNIDHLVRSGFDVAQFDSDPADAAPITSSSVAATQSTIANWSVADVGKWLGEAGFGELAGGFADNDVDGATLLILEKSDISELTGAKVGLTRRVMEAIRTLRVEASRESRSSANAAAAAAAAAAASATTEGSGEAVSARVFAATRDALLRVIRADHPEAVRLEACSVLTLGLKVFYPSHDDQISLLDECLSMHQEHGAAAIALVPAVLEYFSNPDALRRLFLARFNGHGDGSGPSLAKILDQLYTIVIAEGDATLAEAMSGAEAYSPPVDTAAGVGDGEGEGDGESANADGAANDADDDEEEGTVHQSPCTKMLFTFQQHLLTLAARGGAKDSDPQTAAVDYAANVMGESKRLIEAAITANESLGYAAAHTMCPAIDAALKHTFVVELLPSLLVGLSLTTVGSTTSASKVLAAATPLFALLDTVNSTVKAAEVKIPAEAALETKRTFYTKSFVEESAHPYPINTRSDHKVVIPNATELTLVFSKTSRTEGGADYLDLYRSPGRADHFARYSGAYGSGRNGFPKEPVKVPGDSVYFYFQSERYDYGHYGWQVTVSAKLPEVTPPLPWTLDLQKTVGWLSGLLCGSLVVGEPISPAEAANSKWLDSPLLAGGLEAGVVLGDGALVGSPSDVVESKAATSGDAGDGRFELSSADEEAFLNGVMDPKSAASPGVSLFLDVAERHATGANLGAKARGTPVDFQAERAVLACLLKHTGIVGDCLSYARSLENAESASEGGAPRVGDLEALPAPLLTLWRSAHSIKKWILQERDRAQADADMDALTESASGSGGSGGSPGGAAEGDDYGELARQVIEKAQFLLNFSPAATADSVSARVSIVPRNAESKWSKVALLWKSLRRFFTAWKYRRQHMAEPSESISELILSFLRDPVDLVDMLAGISVRSQRALTRVEGFRTFHSLLGSATVPSTKYDLLRALPPALAGNLSYGNCIGCTGGSHTNSLSEDDARYGPKLELGSGSGSASGSYYLDSLATTAQPQMMEVREAFMSLFVDLVSILDSGPEGLELPEGVVAIDPKKAASESTDAAAEPSEMDNNNNTSTADGGVRSRSRSRSRSPAPRSRSGSYSSSDDGPVAAEADAYYGCDPDTIEALMTMGFSLEACVRAARTTGDDVEAASNWLMNHIEDEDLNDPIEAAPVAVAAAVDDTPSLSKSTTKPTAANIKSLPTREEKLAARLPAPALVNVVLACWNMQFRGDDRDFLLQSRIFEVLWDVINPPTVEEAVAEAEADGIAAVVAAATEGDDTVTPAKTSTDTADPDAEANDDDTEVDDLVDMGDVLFAAATVYRLLATQVVASHSGGSDTSEGGSGLSVTDQAGAAGEEDPGRGLADERDDGEATATVESLLGSNVLDVVFDRLEAAECVRNPDAHTKSSGEEEEDDAAGVGGATTGNGTDSDEVSVEKALADVAAEALDAEKDMVYDILAFLFSVSSSPLFHHYVESKPQRLASLLTILATGEATDKIWRLSFRTLRRLLPFIQPATLADVELPSTFASVLAGPDSNNVLAFFSGLVGRVADKVISSSGSTTTTSESGGSGGGSAGGSNVPTKSTAETDDKITVLESVMVLRTLLGADKWKGIVTADMTEAINAVSTLITQPPKQRSKHIWSGLSSLYVMGGVSDFLRVGGRAEYSEENSPLRKTGVVLRINRITNEVHIVPETSTSASSAGSGTASANSSSSTRMKAPKILPIDTVEAVTEIQPEPAYFPLTEGAVPLYTAFLTDGETDSDGKKEPTRSVLYYQFKSASLKALDVMLGHLPSIDVFINAGLAPLLLASAVTPTTLTKCTALAAVEERALYLQKFLMGDGKGVGVTLTIDDGKKKKKKDEETLIAELLEKSGTSHSTYNDLRQTFIGMDVDGDGVITREDMKNYLTPLFGYEVEGRELDEQFGQVDQKHTGAVTLIDWLRSSLGLAGDGSESDDDGYGGNAFLSGLGGGGRKKKKKEPKLLVRVDRPLGAVGIVESATQLFGMSTVEWPDVPANLIAAEPQEFKANRDEGVPAFTNATALSGAVVIMADGGPVNRLAQVKAAQAAGAVGVVLYMDSGSALPTGSVAVDGYVPPTTLDAPKKVPSSYDYGNSLFESGSTPTWGDEYASTTTTSTNLFGSAAPVPLPADGGTADADKKKKKGESEGDDGDEPVSIPLFLIKDSEGERLLAAIKAEEEEEEAGSGGEGGSGAEDSVSAAVQALATKELTKYGFEEERVRLALEHASDINSAAAVILTGELDTLVQQAKRKAKGKDAVGGDEGEGETQAPTPAAPAATTQESKSKNSRGRGKKKRNKQKAWRKKWDEANKASEGGGGGGDGERGGGSKKDKEKKNKKDNKKKEGGGEDDGGIMGFNLFDEDDTGGSGSSSANSAPTDTTGLKPPAGDDGVIASVYYDLDADSKSRKATGAAVETWPSLEGVDDVAEVVTAMQSALATAHARKALATLVSALPSDRPLECLSGADPARLLEFLLLDMATLANKRNSQSVYEVDTVASVLRPRLKASLLEEACGGGSGTLIESLARQAIGHLYRATQFNEGHSAEYTVKTSRHPCISTSDAVSLTKVHIPEAKAIYIQFDPRSCTKYDSNALSFFPSESGDPATAYARCAGAHANFHSLVIPGDTFWYSYSHGSDVSVASESWGWRFVAVSTATTSNDAALLAFPNVEFACWVLEVVLEAASEAAAARGAEDDEVNPRIVLSTPVYTVQVVDLLLDAFDVVVGAQKNRVLRLLSCILDHIEWFPAGELPDLAKFEKLYEAMLSRRSSEGTPIVYSQYLQNLTELMLVAQAAAASMPSVSDPTSPSKKGGKKGKGKGKDSLKIEVSTDTADTKDGDKKKKEGGSDDVSKSSADAAGGSGAFDWGNVVPSPSARWDTGDWSQPTPTPSRASAFPDMSIPAVGGEDGEGESGTPAAATPDTTTDAKTEDGTTGDGDDGTPKPPPLVGWPDEDAAPPANKWFTDLIALRAMFRALDDRTPLPGSTLSAAHESYMKMRKESFVIEKKTWEFVSTDGGQITPGDFEPSHLLDDNSKIYAASSMSNVNVVFKTVSGEPVRITHMKVTAPSSSYPGPIQDTMLFVCKSPADVAKTREFNDYTLSQYQTFVTQKKEAGEGCLPHEPVAFLTTYSSESTSGWVKLDLQPAEGDVIILKFIRPSRGSNIDVGYVGFKGRLGGGEDEPETDTSLSRSAAWNSANSDDSSLGGLFNRRRDEELVSFINDVCERQNAHPAQLRLSDVTFTSEDRERYDMLTSIPLPALRSRFLMLRLLNVSLEDSLPLIDLSVAGEVWSLAAAVTARRAMFFHRIKLVLLRKVLDKSVQYTEGDARIKVDRLAAKAAVETEDAAALSTFSQTLDQLNSLEPKLLRTKKQAFFVRFLGEGANDSGGPYRELISDICGELMAKDPILPLFIPCPNGASNTGLNREKFIPRPSACSPDELTMFVWLGKLMGVAIRTEFTLDLMLPSLTWKPMVSEPLAREDLECIDEMTMNSLDVIRNIEANGVTAAEFEDYVMEEFTTHLSDGTLVCLKPGGDEIPVTFDKRIEFCDLVLKTRLHESSKQIDAIMRGLGTIIPTALLPLFSWQELEMLVCGKATVDLTLLRANTEYAKDVDENAPHITYFWNVLEEFTQAERRLFLRFVWGRSRLPLSSEGFTDKFKIQSRPVADDKNADDDLPVSHTCFFSMQLPRYSSQEILKKKLSFAIVNCQAIDTDFQIQDAAATTSNNNRRDYEEDYSEFDY